MRRALLAVVLMLAATAAGIAAASTFVPAGSTGEQGPDGLEPGPADLIVGASTLDPTRPVEWGVRTYISRTGLLCVERGRLAGPVFGDPDAQGRIRERPAGPTGICGEAADPVVAGIERVAAHDDEPARTFVLGASLRHPERAFVTPREGAVELPLGTRGSFIGVFEGVRESQDLPLTVILADGATTRIDWQGEASAP
jgi:hypothetical protein